MGTIKRRKHGQSSEQGQVDEASRESFPASDAPAFAGGRVRGEGGVVPEYRVRTELRPRALEGIGAEQIDQHWKLYEGYVENVNVLNGKISAHRDAKAFGTEFAELKRRLGFEYDGMILHEHYFGILKPRHKASGEDSAFAAALKPSFKGFDAWKEEFIAMGAMRGVGWVILYLDPQSGRLSNHWIGLHEVGHPAGFAPVLVMDVWEHAYMVDRGASGRKEYVAAFFKNVDWGKAALHVEQARASSGVER